MVSFLSLNSCFTFLICLSIFLFTCGWRTARRANRLQMVADDRVAEIRQIKGLQDGLKMRKLPSSDLVVSELCLGTMMFGDQLTKADAYDQLDTITQQYGINFLDTAESFPAPSAASTAGRTDKIIGQWMKSRKIKRENIVISAKICGYSNELTWCRKNGEPTRLTREQIIEAVDSQLARLKTDHIDLLQFHWPDRYIPMYGAPEYRFDLERSDSTSIQSQLEVIAELIKAGKVRHFGLSNETPHGATKFAVTADLLGLPRPCSIQNSYNLLTRHEFESTMVETCSPVNANLGLLAYSPLAGGALSGKYLDKSTVSPEARLRKYVGFMHRFNAAPSREAIAAYQKVAQHFSLPLSALALAWVYSRRPVVSTLIAATNLDQLRDNVLALNIPIGPEIESKLDEVYWQHLDPSKGAFPVMDPKLEYVDASKLPWGARDQDVDPELDQVLSQRFGM